MKGYILLFGLVLFFLLLSTPVYSEDFSYQSAGDLSGLIGLIGPAGSIEKVGNVYFYTDLEGNTYDMGKPADRPDYSISASSYSITPESHSYSPYYYDNSGNAFTVLPPVETEDVSGHTPDGYITLAPPED